MSIAARGAIDEYLVTYQFGDRNVVYRLRDLPDPQKMKVLMSKAHTSREERDYLKALRAVDERQSPNPRVLVPR
ncbi:MAG: hypothetical protein ACYSU0_21710 [Planctomycetota bacterium]